MTRVDPLVERQLRALSEQYFIAIDARDADAFAGTFLPGGRIVGYTADDETTPTGEWVGREAIAALSPRLAETFTHTFHLMGQATYEVAGDEASGLVYCVAHHLSRAARGGTDHVMYIRYRDTYRRDASGSWKIDVRGCVVSWTELRTTE
jgi:ketosteroid isomerase-like protein